MKEIKPELSTIKNLFKEQTFPTASEDFVEQ